jgi:two-component system cell cycle sensor histidine kinase/response regulator CckA
MNNSPVGKKLGSAFGLLLLLLIGVGWLGLSRMSRTDADLNLLGRDAFKLELAQQAEYYANLNIRLVMQVLILDRKEDIEIFEAKRNENREKGADVIEALRPKIDSEKEIALLANIDNARIPARNSVDRIVSLLNQGKREEARQLMVDDTSPFLEKYQEAWDAFVQFQKDQMDQVQNQSEANYQQTRRIAIGLMIIAIALAVVIAVFATHRIMRDDNLREETKEEVRKLNDELESKIAARTQDLANVIQKLESEIVVRRKSEEDLKRSETELAIAQRIAHVGSFHRNLTKLDDFESNSLHWSDEVFRIFGYEPGQIEPSRANFMQAVHPDDRDSVGRAAQRAILNKESYNHEYRIILPDASERIVQAHWDIDCDQTTGEPSRMFGTIQDITERKKAEERFYKAFNANPEPMTIATMSNGLYIDVNESFLRITGHRREEVIGHTSLDLQFWERPEDRAKFLEILKKRDSVRDLEIIFLTKSGEQRTGMILAEIIEVDGQTCVLAIVKDFTDQKGLEKQLRQSQKMEAIGQLSGGIAHDFNNLLSVIIGYSDLMEVRLPANDPLQKMCEQIKKAGQSAASLTRQLLAFSRQQVLEPKILDLNAIVRNVEKMLRRLIGEEIDFSTALEPALASIKADQGQIEQVIVNLVVNARDAMPHGGKLRIETANVRLDETYARIHPPQQEGPYVSLTVSDTGIGMDAETQAHIFDPFFTTKEVGKGTGLGLSTVYGVVRQSGGHIWVYSELGHGTTFKIYLPLSGRALHVEKSSPGLTETLRGTETILLVEDAQPLRELASSLLAEDGYTVLEAGHPEQAVEIAKRYKGPIHLLLTDMVMPGMNGRVLADKLASIRPEMRVVFMSGYTGFTHSGLIDSELILLAKPFTKDTLLRKLHEVLALKTELEEK